MLHKAVNSFPLAWNR